MSGEKEGTFKGVIKENDVRAAGTGTEFVYLLVDCGDDGSYPVQIWLSRKALGMAKGQLKAAGFVVGEHSLVELRANKEKLKGNAVTIEVNNETYKGTESLKARLVMNSVTKKGLEALDVLLKQDEEALDQPEDDIPF